MLLPPLALYIHIPWCVRKCPYCDFNSHELREGLPEQEYLQALLADLDRQRAFIQNRPLISIFIGGGTPSLLSARFYHQLLEGISKRIVFQSDIEITLEANPGTVEAQRFKGYRACGINRLSIGIQSLNDLHLQHLGRIHNAKEALQAVSLAKEAGFENMNLDLMHGLPSQTREQALSDLEQAIALDCPHLSWYQLTIEPNTYFYRYPPVLPVEDVLCDISDQGQRLLESSGLNRYEVSAYARPGFTCRHNQNYWRFGDYLGIGAGAHGKISLPHEKSVLRTQRPKQPQQYLKTQQNNHNHKTVETEELPFEYFLNRLRLKEAVDISEFEAFTGWSVQAIESRIHRAQALALIEWDGNVMKKTNLGERYLNDLIQIFL